MLDTALTALLYRLLLSYQRTCNSIEAVKILTQDDPPRDQVNEGSPCNGTRDEPMPLLRAPSRFVTPALPIHLHEFDAK